MIGQARNVGELIIDRKTSDFEMLYILTKSNNHNMNEFCMRQIRFDDWQAGLT